MKTPKRTIASIAMILAACSLSYTPTNGLAQPNASVQTVRVTYYLPTGSPMASGNYPYVGAAACSYNYPLGTRLRFLSDGWIVTCEDRGLLGYNGWVDVFSPSSAWGIENVVGAYGDYAEVEVVE